MATVRRSGRARKANTRFNDDVLEEETRKALASVSGSSAESEPDRRSANGDSSGSEFDAGEEAADDVDDRDVNEDEISDNSGHVRGMSEDSEIGTPAEPEEDLMSIASEYDSDGRPAKTRRIGPVKLNDPKKTHFRGLGEIGGSKDFGWIMLFGPAQEDFLPAVYARDIWLKSDDITLPSRASLTKAVSDGEYGKTNRSGISEEQLRQEATTGWDWYYGDKGAQFRGRQRSSRINDQSKQRRYHPVGQMRHHDVVLGPLQQQLKLNIANGESIDIAAAWPTKEAFTTSKAKEGHAAPNHSPNGEAQGKDRPQAPPTKNKKSARGGWLLNVGQKLQCLAWAPNMRGSTQYLAISCSTTSSQRTGFAAHASAMTATPSYPSNIQIWSVESRPTPGEPARLDMTAKPRLRQVLCTDWGDIRQLVWCPVLRQERDSSSDQLPSGNIGIISVVCSDGSVRVIDVSIQQDSTEYVHLDSAAFTILPPTATPIYTSVSFLSPTDLAVSDSVGFIHLFSITASIAHNVDGVVHPYYSSPLPPASTYILRTSPCYPSKFPGLLALSSAGGETTLISVVQPHVDSVSAGRNRLPSAHISYMPQICGHCVSQDDGLYFHPVRRFFTATTLGRASSSGNIMCHDTSRWHPFVIAGTSGGEVFASNALRRVLPLGKLFGVGGNWQQRVLKYDWVPDKAIHQAENYEAANSFHARDVRPGKSRFHEGFRPERPDLHKSTGKVTTTIKKKGVNTEASGVETIFEEENAVTVIQWNPNLACAGWVAMGFGSGLIRIEDYAWE